MPQRLTIRFILAPGDGGMRLIIEISPDLSINSGTPLTLIERQTAFPTKNVERTRRSSRVTLPGLLKYR
jgi:hypothetical protein